MSGGAPEVLWGRASFVAGRTAGKQKNNTTQETKTFPLFKNILSLGLGQLIIAKHHAIGDGLASTDFVKAIFERIASRARGDSQCSTLNLPQTLPPLTSLHHLIKKPP